MIKLYDKFYNENSDTKVRNISDIALAHRADEIANNPKYDDVQRKDANFISGIMKTKVKFGLGVELKKNGTKSWPTSCMPQSKESLSDVELFPTVSMMFGAVI